MKDIPGYEGLYAATEDGQIWSYRRQRFLKPSINGGGYLKVALCKDGNPKTYHVHRLIALTYISNPDNLPEIDHIDRDKLNNSIKNLRWVSRRENVLNRDLEQIREKMRENYRNMPEEARKEQTQKARQALCKSVEMRDKNNHNILLKTYPSSRQAAIQEFGDITKESGIAACARGKQNSAYGYFWTHIDSDVSREEET